MMQMGRTALRSRRPRALAILADVRRRLYAILAEEEEAGG
jgi:hypothetical protein